ncbi:hypothetical protein SAMN02787142_7722 [Burkholderia sp. WP9]|nr:hypothetical protein SAMN02787142_7722 [Burkholderia sp. WP9]
MKPDPLTQLIDTLRSRVSQLDWDVILLAAMLGLTALLVAALAILLITMLP